MARPRDRVTEDLQQVKVIKETDGKVLTSEASVLRRWMECFEKVINEENEKELVWLKTQWISKERVRTATKRKKNGKTVGPDEA